MAPVLDVFARGLPHALRITVEQARERSTASGDAELSGAVAALLAVIA